MNEITVHVTKHGKRKFLVMYYDCPITGKREQRSTKETELVAAERVAAVWEAELREGRYKRISNITWSEFRERYENEVVSSFKKSTADTLTGVFNAVERICKPDRLRQLTAERLSYFQGEFRRGEVIDDKSGQRHSPRSEHTVKSYLSHLKAALKWAADVGMLVSAPKIKMPVRIKGGKMMKGRPITAEEFDRMLAKIKQGLIVASERTANKGKGKRKMSDVAKAKRVERRNVSASMAVASWERLLTGLWLSGLRLGEAMELYWDDETKLTVDLTGRRPMFRILAELEKGNQDRLLPMTPDFAVFLEATPKAERVGPVFRPLAMSGLECRKEDYAGKIIASIGRLAGVKVDTDTRTKKVKYASAHDLRRAFGARWATRVMPIVLQQLMRHEDIETTLKYYVGQNAEATADAVWAAAERVGTLIGTSVSGTLSPETQKAETLGR